MILIDEDDCHELPVDPTIRQQFYISSDYTQHMCRVIGFHSPSSMEAQAQVGDYVPTSFAPWDLQLEREGRLLPLLHANGSYRIGTCHPKAIIGDPAHAKKCASIIDNLPAGTQDFLASNPDTQAMVKRSTRNPALRDIASDPNTPLMADGVCPLRLYTDSDDSTHLWQDLCAKLVDDLSPETQAAMIQIGRSALKEQIGLSSKKAHILIPLLEATLATGPYPEGTSQSYRKQEIISAASASLVNNYSHFSLADQERIIESPNPHLRLTAVLQRRTSLDLRLFFDPNPTIRYALRHRLYSEGWESVEDRDLPLDRTTLLEIVENDPTLQWKFLTTLAPPQITSVIRHRIRTGPQLVNEIWAWYNTLSPQEQQAAEARAVFDALTKYGAIRGTGTLRSTEIFL